MAKFGGMTGYADIVSTANGPFKVLVEDADGMIGKISLAELASVKTITATDSITEAEHAGRVNLLGEVGGNALVTLTLPAATGSGNRYTFVVSVVNTSNYVIQANTTGVTFEGVAWVTQDGGDTSVAFESGASDDTITLNGTTTGGAAIGDKLEFIDIGSGLWCVHAFLTASGIEATPFSNAVTT